MALLLATLINESKNQRLDFGNRVQSPNNQAQRG